LLPVTWDPAAGDIAIFFYRSIIANAGQEELMKIISGFQFPD